MSDNSITLKELLRKLGTTKEELTVVNPVSETTILNWCNFTGREFGCTNRSCPFPHGNFIFLHGEKIVARMRQDNKGHWKIYEETNGEDTMKDGNKKPKRIVPPPPPNPNSLGGGGLNEDGKKKVPPPFPLPPNPNLPGGGKKIVPPPPPPPPPLEVKIPKENPDKKCKYGIHCKDPENCRYKQGHDECPYDSNCSICNKSSAAVVSTASAKEHSGGGGGHPPAISVNCESQTPSSTKFQFNQNAPEFISRKSHMNEVCNQDEDEEDYDGYDDDEYDSTFEGEYPQSGCNDNSDGCAEPIEYNIMERDFKDENKWYPASMDCFSCKGFIHRENCVPCLEKFNTKNKKMEKDDEDEDDESCGDVFCKESKDCKCCRGAKLNCACVKHKSQPQCTECVKK